VLLLSTLEAMQCLSSSQLVSTDELLRAVWPDERVTTASVKRAIAGARRVLGDDGASQRSIRTLRGCGYRLMLHVAVRSFDKKPEAPAGALLAGPTAPALRLHAQGTFVGRERVLARLEARLADALAGHGGVELLSGPAGIGKTRTLVEFKRRLEALKLPTRFARCIEEEGTPALWPWTQILCAGATAGGAPDLSALIAAKMDASAAGIHALFHRLPVTAEVPVLKQAVARFRFFDAVATALERAAEERPIVIMFDDVQRADPVALRLLSFVARRIEAARVLIVLGARTHAAPHEDARPELERMLRELHPYPVALDGLSLDEVARYTELYTGQAPTSAMVERFHRLTGGNPLLVQQVAHTETAGRFHE
jgi:hypothetical protein